MLFGAVGLLCAAAAAASVLPGDAQRPLDQELAPAAAAASSASSHAISPELFDELYQLGRLVDISYCVGSVATEPSRPFKCPSHCSAFPTVTLVKTWSTGPFLSDSCGYIAVDHNEANPRIIVAFRGTYSIANTIIDLSTLPQKFSPYEGDAESCKNCTVHTGFYTAWQHTRPEVLDVLEETLAEHPDATLHLVGHSLGGAVALFAALEYTNMIRTSASEVVVTTFGEPRVGNKQFVEYVDRRLASYRRITHIKDPIPLLPPTEWQYRPHAGEIYITKEELPPTFEDVVHCKGDEDRNCSAGQDETLLSLAKEGSVRVKRDLKLADEKDEEEVISSGLIPTRYQLWSLFTAHRDYFLNLGLCMPKDEEGNGGWWDWKRFPDPFFEDRTWF